MKPWAYYNEIDEGKAFILRELMNAGQITEGQIDTRSIADVRGDDVRGFARCHFFAGVGLWDAALTRAGWPDDRVVWTASCPCPSFSVAGKGEGLADPRHLWPHCRRIARECRPFCFFGEQVSAAIGYGWLDLVQHDLEAEGYAVGKVVFPACSVGAPHERQRLYWAAWLADDRGARLEERRGIAGDAGRQRAATDGDSGAVRMGPTNGAWAGADWALTRPQRVGDRPSLRPVKRGIFPLAHGRAGRVLALRAAGDAIVLPQAQAWVETVMEEIGTR